VELQRQRLLEKQHAENFSFTSVDGEFTLPDGSGGVFSGSDSSIILTKEIELQQRVLEETYSEHVSDLKKAEEDLRLKEELYRREDEARLEKLSAQNSFVEKLDVRKVQLMYFIDAQQQLALSGFETPLSTSMSHSEGDLNAVCDGWQERMYSAAARTVSSASGRLLASSKNAVGKPLVNGVTYPNAVDFSGESQSEWFKNGHEFRRLSTCNGVIDHKTLPVRRNVFYSTSDFAQKLAVPWRLLSDDPDAKSKSASAPRLSDEASTSSQSDETLSRSLLLSARSPSPPRTTQLSSLSLVSVPESIHEEREESPVSSRLSISEVDIRRRQFASAADNKTRWSLDDEQLSRQNTAASVRRLTGNNQDVVITDSGLPSSPEAGHLNSSVPCDVNAAKQLKEKASGHREVKKSSDKPEPGILKKIGATISSLTRRQHTKSEPVKSESGRFSLSSKVSRQKTDTSSLRESHPSHVDKAKIQASASKKLAADQSASKSKQSSNAKPHRYLKTFRGRSSVVAERKQKPVSDVDGKPTVPAKVRESFRSFRKRLKLTADRSAKTQSGDIPVEIYLPKPKEMDGRKDGHNELYATELQKCNVAGNSCLNGDVVIQHMSSDGPQWTGGFELLLGADTMKFGTANGCVDDGPFSDDSLNGQISSSGQAVEFPLRHIIGPVCDDQFRFSREQTSAQSPCFHTNSDDDSFSEDSLAEDVSTGSADAAVKDDDQKLLAVLLQQNYDDVSSFSAVEYTACIESEISRSRQLGKGFISHDVLEPQEQSGWCDDSVYQQNGQSGVFSTSNVPPHATSVPKDDSALNQTGSFIADHLSSGGTSTSAAW